MASAQTQATVRRNPNIRPGKGRADRNSIELLTGDIGYEHANDIEKETNKIDEEEEHTHSDHELEGGTREERTREVREADERMNGGEGKVHPAREWRAMGARAESMREAGEEGARSGRSMKARVEDEEEQGDKTKAGTQPMHEPRCRERSHQKSMTAAQAIDTIAKHLTTNKAQLFPTTRRPEPRELSNETQEVMDQWVENGGINVYEGLSPEERKKANQLLYTWKDVFESDLLRIRTTDLIEHGIDLEADSIPSRSKVPLSQRLSCDLSTD